MPPKAQVFKSPDGQEFTTRAAWRDHMMATYYSFSNIKGTIPAHRLPGSIDGQMYNIADCEDTELVVMDHCEQVQIDQCKNSKIFIGACESSMFIRNCDNCTFYIACRQLRLREVTNCKFFCFSTAEVHIEYSNNVQFAPFHGGYAEQAQHLTAAKLPYQDHNLWYDVFDHNDPGKTRTNWSLLPVGEYGDAWYPAGGCEPAVPLTKPGSVLRVDGDTTGDAGKEGAVQSFALPHNEEAAKASSPVKSMADRLHEATRDLSMEAALLVASAMGKGVDVSVWLMEGAAKDTTVEHFNDRLISLALSVGIEEDWDTKRELEVAVSSKSLKNIKTLFACGAKGAFIDVSMFLNVAQQKVQDYMASLTDNSDGQGEREVDMASQQAAGPSSRSAGGTIISSVGDSVSGNSWDGEGDELPEEDDEVRLVDEDSEEEDQYNPTSPPAPRVHVLKKDVFRSPSLSDRPGDSATNALLPDSPYDEEVAFDLDEEEEADTADGYKRRNPVVMSNLMQASSGKPTVPKLSATDARVLSSPQKSSSVKKAASPTSPTQARTSPVAESTPISANKASAAARRIKGGSFTRAAREIVAESSPDAAVLRPRSAAAPKSRSMAASVPRPASAASKNTSLNISRNSAVRMSSTSMASSLYPADIVQAVEDQVRNVVQRTDLYHLVQVHLGFIDTYTMVPPRGLAVVSTPRARLSVNELQTAFFQARLRLTDPQILAIMKLVTRYAREKMGDEKSEEEINAEVVAPGARLSSEWLKKYMVHLRLTKKKSLAASQEEPQVGSSLENQEGISSNIRSSRDEPLQFNTWLGAKIVEDRKEVERKPKEFQKALAGQKHILNREELENYLVQHSIIPSDLLKEEITLRVQSWSLDISGRKDYTHAWNLAVRKWDREHVNEDYRRLKEDRKKEVSAEIRARLLRDHAESLRKSEKEKQTITKELFWRFQRAASKAQVGLALTWGQWLSKHQASEAKLIATSKQDSEERSRLMAKRKERKQALAPLVEIEKKFNEAADKLTTFHSIELRKCLVGLRKRAIAAGLGSGDKLLVTKDLFDSQMANVLAPRMQQLDPELRGFAEEARKSHEGMGSTANSDAQFTCLVDAIFKEDYKQADIKAAEIQLLNEEQAELEFKEWEERKKQQKLTVAEKARQKREEIEEEKKKRQKLADKAYRQWVKLRRTGKYASRVDKRPHPLPETNRVDHDGRWSKDVEIIHPEVSYL